MIDVLTSNTGEYTEKCWLGLMLDSRKETYTRVFAGRLLHFLYDRFENLLSSESVDYVSIVTCFLKALDEVRDYNIFGIHLRLTET